MLKTRVFNEFLNAYKITEDVGKKKDNNFEGFRKQNVTTFCNNKMEEEKHEFMFKVRFPRINNKKCMLRDIQ